MCWLGVFQQVGGLDSFQPARGRSRCGVKEVAWRRAEVEAGFSASAAKCRPFDSAQDRNDGFCDVILGRRISRADDVRLWYLGFALRTVRGRGIFRRAPGRFRKGPSSEVDFGSGGKKRFEGVPGCMSAEKKFKLFILYGFPKVCQGWTGWRLWVWTKRWLTRALWYGGQRTILMS